MAKENELTFGTVVTVDDQPIDAIVLSVDAPRVTIAIEQTTALEGIFGYKLQVVMIDRVEVA